MDFGASMFFTDYSMSAADLARALEDRGFESLGAGAFAYSAVPPLPYPGGGDLPKPYYDTMDPFVTLTTAAAATSRLKVGTGVCLIIQRDPIQTASWLLRSIRSRAGGSCSAQGTGGMPKKWKITAPLRDAAQAGARTGRGDEGDLDSIEA